MMHKNIFNNFIDSTQLWIFPFSRNLSDSESSLVQTELDKFITEWHAHGESVCGEYQILYDRFVLITGEVADKISGCSIDSSVRVFKYLRDNHNLDALDRSMIFYKKGNSVESVNSDEFQDLVDRNLISDDTLVFNLNVTTLDDLRAGRWELPFSKSWHKKSFINSEVT